MKTYRNLYEKLLEEETIVNTLKNTHNDRFRDQIRQLRDDYQLMPRKTLAYIRNSVVQYEVLPHHIIQINDGITKKQREIVIPTFQEVLVQHLIVSVLEPIILKPMYEQVYGSLPARGCHAAKKRIQSWIINTPADCKYFCKMDIRKFFPSINNDILFNILEEKIADRRFMNVLYKFIVCEEQSGLPLGYYSSPWFAHIYLNEMDRLISDDPNVVHYIRYMDDILILGPNKKKLKDSADRIDDYLRSKRDIELKNYHVDRFSYKDKPRDDAERADIRLRKDRGQHIDFMGFKFFRTRIILRKSLMLKISRTVRNIDQTETITLHDARSVLSYLGWIYATDSYKFYDKHIRPYVNIEECKSICSQYDKSHNKKRVDACASGIY